MGSLSLVMSESSVYRWYTQLDSRRFVYDTYKTIKATRSRHGWVHMFITHCLQQNLQLHNFDLFRTCPSSFCTVAWLLARFQLTRRIARSLGDSWASCYYRVRSSVRPTRTNQKVQSLTYHGLRGSASPVLTATGFVNGRWQFSTPHRINTPW